MISPWTISRSLLQRPGVVLQVADLGLLLDDPGTEFRHDARLSAEGVGQVAAGQQPDVRARKRSDLAPNASLAPARPCCSSNCWLPRPGGMSV